MTIDTTVTNARFVHPDGLREQSLSIHDGKVLDTPELTDVWRTIDASGHLVFPGLLQPGHLAGETPLRLARRGTTTLLIDGQPAVASAIDYIDVSSARIVQITDADALQQARNGLAMLQISATLLIDTEESSLWDIVADDELAVHVTCGDDPDFPLLPMLYHQGAVTPERIAAITSGNPARWLGLHPLKGTFQPGSHGDLVVFDPDSDDPYHDSRWPGRVIMSIQRGELLLYNGQVHIPAGSAQDLSTAN